MQGPFSQYSFLMSRHCLGAVSCLWFHHHSYSKYLLHSVWVMWHFGLMASLAKPPDGRKSTSMLHHLHCAIRATTQLLLTCFPMGSTGLVFLLFVPCVEQVSHIQKGSLQLFTTVVFVLLQLPLFLITSDFGYEGVIKNCFECHPLGHWITDRGCCHVHKTVHLHLSSSILMTVHPQEYCRAVE